MAQRNPPLVGAWMQQDAEGNWHTGAIAAATDDVCAAAIMSVEGIIKVSVHYDISYFAPAKLHVRSLTTISDPSDFLFPPRQSYTDWSRVVASKSTLCSSPSQAPASMT